MRESLNNFRVRAAHGVNAFLDWITFGRGGKPTDFETAHARAAYIADRIIFWMPFLIIVVAVLPTDSLLPFDFPNIVVMVLGFFAVFQTKLYRLQLDVSKTLADKYIASLEEQKDIIITNRTLELMNASLLADNVHLMAENARLGGRTMRQSGPTPPFGGMTH